MRAARGVVWFAVLGVSACDDGARKEPLLTGKVVTLEGRAFSADTGEPLSGAKVAVGDRAVQTDGSGAFTVTHQGGAQKMVEVLKEQHAPVRKTAPAGDGYVEITAKRYDAQKEIDPAAGGDVKAASGVKLSIGKAALSDELGASPESALFSVAAPDPTKAGGLGALPGEFVVEKAGRLGKLSAESPVYVKVVSSEGKTLKVRSGEKVALTLPLYKRSATKAPGSALYHFDEQADRWVHVGDVRDGTDENGNPTYEGEIDRFGWFTTGSFVEQLTCLRACVLDRNERPVPSARALLTGVDLFTQGTAYAGADGCFAVEVPANSRQVLTVEAGDGFAEARLVQAASGGDVSKPGSCQALKPITLSPRPDSSCPLALSECGGRCVDLSSDNDHCGACGHVCETRCVLGACEEDTSGGDAGAEDAGDGGATSPDAGMDAGTPDGGGADRDAAQGADGGVREPPDAGADANPAYDAGDVEPPDAGVDAASDLDAGDASDAAPAPDATSSVDSGPPNCGLISCPQDYVCCNPGCGGCGTSGCAVYSCTY